MALDLRTHLSVAEALDRVDAALRGGILANGECLDRYERLAPQGRQLTVVVYTKHDARLGGNITLTITADDLQGPTFLHIVSSGGGRGWLGLGRLLHRAEKWEELVRRALEEEGPSPAPNLA